MADMTKVHQTERMSMDLTILANFSQICPNEINSAGLTILKNFSPIRQSKISFAGLTILSNFCHSRYCMHFWTYLVPRASATKGPRTLGTIFLAYAIAVCPLVVSLRKESLRQPEVSLSPRLSFFQPSARSLLA